jgi:SAM-dependent methyltransferase
MSITVEEAAKQLNLTGPFPQHKYVKHMLSAFGRNGESFLDAVDSWLASGGEQSEADQLYSMLAKCPLMADYVTRHQYSAIYKIVGSTLTAWGQLQECSVVDVGCGFGHLTSLLSRLHPTSKFIGLDKAKVIAAARKLNAFPQVPNLEFKTANQLPAEAAQVALMVCVTHEAFPSVMAPGTQPVASELEFARKICELMGQDGLLVTINRFPWPIWQLPRLDELFASFQLYPCDAGLPASIEVPEGDRISLLPARAYRFKH